MLNAGVKFYAALGNPDDPNERFYKPFNMDGKCYYSFKNSNAIFFALDSNYMDPEQTNLLQRQLPDLRTRLEPILEEHGGDVVFSGHEHVYERLKPLNGIYYFGAGEREEFRFHDLRPSTDTAKGYRYYRPYGHYDRWGYWRAY